MCADHAKKAALYRFFGADGKLLYVGISADAFNRAKGHASTSDWSDEAASMTVTRYPTRFAAMKAERQAIGVECPLYNKARPPEMLPPPAPEGMEMVGEDDEFPHLTATLDDMEADGFRLEFEAPGTVKLHFGDMSYAMLSLDMLEAISRMTRAAENWFDEMLRSPNGAARNELYDLGMTPTFPRTADEVWRTEEDCQKC